jgi:cysteine desulfurase
MTQSIGKSWVDFENVDLASFSAHKFFGIKGIGCLIKKENILIEPLINGGKSTTIFRSWTPQLPLIVSLAKALRLSLENINEKRKKVEELNNYLKEQLKSIDRVIINSNQYCIPHILNISILGAKPETIQHALEEYNIYISTQTACSEDNSKSLSVLALTNDLERAKSSIRISISHLTTKEELDEFISSLKKIISNLLS